jgi:hypothetical protein
LQIIALSRECLIVGRILSGIGLGRAFRYWKWSVGKPHSLYLQVLSVRQPLYCWQRLARQQREEHVSLYTWSIYSKREIKKRIDSQTCFTLFREPYQSRWMRSTFNAKLWHLPKLLDRELSSLCIHSPICHSFSSYVASSTKSTLSR